jgi:hypothetical protein
MPFFLSYVNCTTLFTAYNIYTGNLFFTIYILKTSNKNEFSKNGIKIYQRP